MEKIGAKSLKGRQGNGLEDFESWFKGLFCDSEGVFRGSEACFRGSRGVFFGSRAIFLVQIGHKTGKFDGKRPFPLRPLAASLSLVPQTEYNTTKGGWSAWRMRCS